MHAPALAAIEATPSLQSSPAASDPAAVLNCVSSTNLSATVAEAALETDGPSAAVAEAAVKTDGTEKNPAAVAEAAAETEGIDNPSAVTEAASGTDGTENRSAAVAEADVETDGINKESAAVAEAVVEIKGINSISAALATAALESGLIDNPSAAALETEGIDDASAAVAEADPYVKHAADAAVKLEDGSPQKSESSFPSSAEGADTHYSVDTVQRCASRTGDETPCSQKQSVNSEAAMAEDMKVAAANLQATGCSHSGLGQSQSGAEGVLPEESPVSEAALDKMLELQLQRIKDSAVMLPETAEVLVTDLFDHRWIRCCAGLY